MTAAGDQSSASSSGRVMTRTPADPRRFGRIGVLAGGPSSEREISLRSGRTVFKALSELGCDTIFLDIVDDVDGALRRSPVDLAFIALHGRFGEDGTVQSILEEKKIPYTGSGVVASGLALDKIASKEIFKKRGITIPDYYVVERTDVDTDRLSGLRFPLVVKPQREGSSIGLSVARTDADLRGCIETALRYDPKVIVEEYIQGRELTVGILGEEALPVVEIVPKNHLYSYDAKYNDTETRYLVPAEIGEREYQLSQRFGLEAHQCLGCRHFSRVDMILDAAGDIHVLEVNSIPGMTERSLLPKAARAAGINFNELCLMIVEMAYVVIA